MEAKQDKSTKRKRADGNRAVLRRASLGQGINVGDRVMDTLIKQSATVTKVIPSAIMPSWIVAYLVRYDAPPPMEYNMGALDSVQFSKWIRLL